MQEYNIRIPEDLSVVACGGENSEMLDKFDLSSISYNYKKIVETTIKCIEQFFRTGKCGITRIHPILTQRKSSLQYSKKGEIA